MTMNYPTKTPWGDAQSINDIVPGIVVSVSTASHGGIGVDAAFANEYLSAECRAFGIDTEDDNILWFEEDVDGCAPLLELLDSAMYGDIVVTQMRSGIDESEKHRYDKDCMKAICHNVLSRYRPEYIAAKTKRKDDHGLRH